MFGQGSDVSRRIKGRLQVNKFSTKDYVRVWMSPYNKSRLHVNKFATKDYVRVRMSLTEKEQASVRVSGFGCPHRMVKQASQTRQQVCHARLFR